jgi:hypothetical protein
MKVGEEKKNCYKVLSKKMACLAFIIDKLSVSRKSER